MEMIKVANEYNLLSIDESFRMSLYFCLDYKNYNLLNYFITKIEKINYLDQSLNQIDKKEHENLAELFEFGNFRDFHNKYCKNIELWSRCDLCDNIKNAFEEYKRVVGLFKKTINIEIIKKSLKCEQCFKCFFDMIELFSDIIDENLISIC